MRARLCLCRLHRVDSRGGPRYSDGGRGPPTVHPAHTLERFGPAASGAASPAGLPPAEVSVWSTGVSHLRRPGRALGQPHRQGRAPRARAPAAAPGARRRPRPAAEATGRRGRARAVEQRDGRRQGVGEEAHVGVDERQHAVVARSGFRHARRRRRAACPASPAAADRRTPTAPAGRLPSARPPRCRRSSRRRRRRSAGPATPRWSSSAARQSPTCRASSRTGSTTVTGRRTGGGSSGGGAPGPCSPRRAARPATESAGAGAHQPAAHRRARRCTTQRDEHRHRQRAPQAAEPGRPSQPAWASAPPRVIQPRASSGAAARSGRVGDRRPRDQDVEQRHEHDAGEQPAGRGWSAARCRCRAAPAAGAPSVQ